MVNVKCNLRELSMEIEGNGLTIMSELCYIVDMVCESFTEDEDDPVGFKNAMIRSVAHALLRKVRENEKVNS